MSTSSPQNPSLNATLDGLCAAQALLAEQINNLQAAQDLLDNVRAAQDLLAEQIEHLRQQALASVAVTPEVDVCTRVTNAYHAGQRWNDIGALLQYRWPNLFTARWRVWDTLYYHDVALRGDHWQVASAVRRREIERSIRRHASVFHNGVLPQEALDAAA